ncbi:MAG: hypothetical protein KOO61_01455 [Spirochaetales bacterium]|nr:hypothetical protein [Spirochaetales bacterium]
MRRTAPRKTLLFLTLLVFVIYPAIASERVQRTVSAAESFLPLAFLLIQGTDTPFELAVVGGSVMLQTVPNVLMLIAEATERPELTRITRWANFGIDSAIATGLLGVGIAYFAGAFGPEADLRARGGLYLALSIPAGVAAFVDFLPYSVESAGRPADGE